MTKEADVRPEPARMRGESAATSGSEPSGSKSGFWRGAIMVMLIWGSLDLAHMLGKHEGRHEGVAEAIAVINAELVADRQGQVPGKPQETEPNQAPRADQ